MDFCRKDEADYIVLPVNEYHGLCKYKDMWDKRVYKLIDRTKADEDGWELLMADQRYFKSAGRDLWLVTYRCPVPTALYYEDAYAMIVDQIDSKFFALSHIDLLKFADAFERETGNERHQARDHRLLGRARGKV